MRAVRRQSRLSPEEYLAFERIAEGRHEYVAGEVHAMVGASLAHNRIARRLLIALEARLQGGPCEVFFSDVMVAVEAAEAYYYPDLVVSCDPRETDTHILRYPRLIVEVLSPSTAAVDRRQKRQHYQTIATVAEIVLVDPEGRAVEVYRRDGAGWLVETVQGVESLELAAVGVAIPLAAVFA